MTEVLPYAPTEKWMLGEFEVLGVLGEGGSGTVYAAVFHGGEVALKVLRDDLTLSDRERARFLQEADRMRRVEHAGLISLLGSGVLSDGRPYICMPRLHGETLARRLSRGRMPVELAVGIFDVMARAIGALHQEGLIHRDLKPENVFLEGPVDPSGQFSPPQAGVPPRLAASSDAAPHPIVLDLGIAREAADQQSTTTLAGQLRGTPAYMAPERFFGSPANAQTDVYELAVTLYLMLVGSLPWDGAQSASARLSPRHPRAVGVDLPGDLVTVMLRALSTRPEVRPQSADAFADAIGAAMGQPSDVGRTTASLNIESRPDVSALDVESAPSQSRTPWIVMALAVSAIGVAAIAMRQPARSSGTSGVSEQGPPAAAIVPPQRPNEPVSPPEPVAPPVVPVAQAPALPPPQAAPAPVSVRPAVRSSSGPTRLAHPVASAPAPAAPSASSVPADPQRYYIDRK